MKIIIIEDEKPAARLLQRKLEKLNFSAEVMLHSVEESLDWFCENQHPDLIFLDIEMPLMDGWDFMNHIESLMKEHSLVDIKIYIVSSSISHEDFEKAESNKNVLGYYSKPIKAEEITAIIMNN